MSKEIFSKTSQNSVPNSIFKDYDISQLSQFIGHNIEISNLDSSTSYQYQKFNYYTNENELILLDEETNCKTYITLEDIMQFNHINNDIYRDVITITHSNDSLLICLAESKPSLPCCGKCGKELEDYDEEIWNVNQRAGYGSKLDGVKVTIKLCDDCFTEMFSDIMSFYEAP